MKKSKRESSLKCQKVVFKKKTFGTSDSSASERFSWPISRLYLARNSQYRTRSSTDSEFEILKPAGRPAPRVRGAGVASPSRLNFLIAVPGPPRPAGFLRALSRARPAPPKFFDCGPGPAPPRGKCPTPRLSRGTYPMLKKS